MSTVIKAGQAGTMLKRLSTVDLADHLAEARAVIEDAKRQAAELKLRAREEARRVLEEAQSKGYADGSRRGFDEGFAAGKQEAYTAATEKFDREHAAVAADFQRVIAELVQTKDEIRAAALRDVLEFSVMLARKLTFEVGRLHRESAQENLRRALEWVDKKTDLVIRVHPSDLDTMNTFASAALRKAERSNAVRVVADEGVQPGGCVVQNEVSQVDATLETQTGEIVSLLLGHGEPNG